MKRCVRIPFADVVAMLHLICTLFAMRKGVSSLFTTHQEYVIIIYVGKGM